MSSIDIRTNRVVLLEITKDSLPPLLPRKVSNLAAEDNFIPMLQQIIGDAILLGSCREPDLGSKGAAPDIDLAAVLVGIGKLLNRQITVGQVMLRFQAKKNHCPGKILPLRCQIPTSAVCSRAAFQSMRQRTRQGCASRVGALRQITDSRTMTSLANKRSG